MIPADFESIILTDQGCNGLLTEIVFAHSIEVTGVSPEDKGNACAELPEYTMLKVL